MFERETIRVSRVLDDEPMVIRISEIAFLATNADENGPQEGVAAIYLKNGVGLACNATVDDVLELIREKETTQ